MMLRHVIAATASEHQMGVADGRNTFARWLFPLWLGVLLLALSSGVVAGAIVLIRGLSVTNLSDLIPWGLWIGLDLSSIALGAGAFLLSAAVYLLRLKHLEPVARTAVFIGLLGYTSACLCLLMDIGRPERFWHAVVFWNIHSPLWEVTMCVVLYLNVLMLEVLPIIGRHAWLQRRWPRISALLQRVHHLAPVLAVVGLSLSMLHQSSLGATYGILKARPIWYRPGMAVLFIVSAMAAGPALTVLASKLAGHLSPRARVDNKLLDQVSVFVGWVLVAYLYLRFWDFLSMHYTYEPGRTEAMELLTHGPLAFNFWVGEIILGIIIPILILLNSRLRRQERLHMLALALVVGGLVAYRWDTNMVGQMVVVSLLPQQLEPLYTRYVPSLIEIVSSAGVVAYGLLAFTLGARYLGIVDHFALPEHEKG